MSDATAAAGTAPGHVTGYGTKGYRNFVLISLMLVYTLNFIDRTVINVVAQPIMNSFNITDEQFGWLIGPPFALFYALMGIPIAMWADRGNRVWIISICIVIWSIMTVLCGLAAGFVWLLLFRIGVAIGEAGCTPPANSIITDYYPPKSRATAIGIYSMGVTIGGVLAQLFGGAIAGLKGETVGGWIDALGLNFLFKGIEWANVEGWRVAFVLVGLPGVLIALVLFLTVKEPPRGFSDPPSGRPKKAGFLDAFKEFGKKPTFWTASLGAAFVAFVGYGLNGFQAPFLQRVHGINVRDAAIVYGAPLAAFAAFGTFAGGYLTEKLSGRYESVVAWLPAVGLLIAIPAYLAAFFSPTVTLAFLFWIVAAIAHYAYLGAQYSITTSIVSPESRATTVSVLLLIVSLIGNGLGPLFTGWMSTFAMKRSLTADGLGDMIADFKPSLCASQVDLLGENGPALCSAYAEGLRWSMAATAVVFVIAAIFFLLAARTYKADRYNSEAPA